MRSILKLLIPVSIWQYLREVTYRYRVKAEFRLDNRRYLKFATPENKINPSISHVGIEGLAIKEIHKIEKGLALSAPKRPFGETILNRLEKLEPLLDPGSRWRIEALQTRNALEGWNLNGTIDDTVSPKVLAPLPFNTSEVHRLFETRRSVRVFDNQRQVPRQVLLDAAYLAGLSPSVCNRQAWRVVFAESAEAKTVLRQHQNGNLGFGDIPVIALVLVDIRYFSGSGERNQAWIEGGIFSMALCLAMHSLGLATCMLNLSVPNSVADSLRSKFELQDWEVPIMMIAAGYAPSSYRVARSTRKGDQTLISII